MKIVHTIADLRASISLAKKNAQRVAFVPTMGNLHAGHLSLVEEAKLHGSFIVASIFVNPMQFGENEDLDAYPRTLDADAKVLQAQGCDLIFAPSAKEIYPQGLDGETRVNVPGISSLHCGASRPGHFTGVATVVSKLFNLVQPDSAIFGNKDFQQLAVIKKMVRDLKFPIDIVGIETSREPSGLARSSRNGYLSEEELELASNLYRSLQQCYQHLQQAKVNLEELIDNESHRLTSLGFKIDYFHIAHPDTLELSQNTDTEFVILLAVWLSNTRLIDNIRVSR